MSKPITCHAGEIGRIVVAEPGDESGEVYDFAIVLTFESAEELHRALNAEAVKLEF